MTGENQRLRGGIHGLQRHRRIHDGVVRSRGVEIVPTSNNPTHERDLHVSARLQFAVHCCDRKIGVWKLVDPTATCMDDTVH